MNFLLYHRLYFFHYLNDNKVWDCYIILVFLNKIIYYLIFLLYLLFQLKKKYLLRKIYQYFIVIVSNSFLGFNSHIKLSLLHISLLPNLI